MALTKIKVESGVQLLARLIKKPVVENFYSNLFQPGLKNNDVVELFGRNSSTLLIDLISEALLPNMSNNTEPLGVLVFNTDGRLNYIELVNALKIKLKSVHTNIDCDTEIDTFLQKTLNNLFILDVYDATQFYTTIHNLDNILAHQNVSVLIFDTLTAFYWSEQGFKITKMDLYMKNLLRMIQKVSKEYKVILIYTRPSYFNSSKDSSNIGEITLTGGINFKVQIINNNDTGTYEVNVRTNDLYFKKYMSIIDNEINWQ